MGGYRWRNTVYHLAIVGEITNFKLAIKQVNEMHLNSLIFMIRLNCFVSDSLNFVMSTALQSASH